MGEHEYSQGVCMDGAAILKDGQMMTIEEILLQLRYSQARIAELEKKNRHHQARRNELRAQSGQGVEAVAWCHEKVFVKNIGRGDRFEGTTRKPEGMHAVGMVSLYTHPRPAQQGVPEDALWEVFEAAADVLFQRAAPHAWEAQVQDACRKVIMKWRDKITAAPQPEGDGRVPKSWGVVPIEPTEAMLRDAADNLCGQFGVEFVRPKEQFARAVARELWRLAPQPPQESEGDE